MGRMEVFISQGQPRSKALAEKLRDFVRLVTPTDPWTSEQIQKGADWPSALAARLKNAKAAMAVLTPENLTNRWVHFEVGALSHTPSEKVWTVLLDLKPEDVEPPLGWRQHTRIDDEKQMLDMVLNINDTTGAEQRPTDDVRKMFGLLWGELCKDVETIRVMDKTVAPTRNRDEVLNEILGLVRGSSRVGWRTDKILAMQHLIFEAITKRKAPTLAELKGGMSLGDLITMADSTSPSLYEDARFWAYLAKSPPEGPFGGELSTWAKLREAATREGKSAKHEEQKDGEKPPGDDDPTGS